MSFDQREETELWNNQFPVQGFRTSGFTVHALALTKRHAGSGNEIIRNTNKHFNQFKCYLSF